MESLDWVAVGFPILLFFCFCSASRDRTSEITDPRYVNSLTASQVEPTPAPAIGFLTSEQKVAGTVRCIQTTSDSQQPMIPSEMSTVCLIPKQMDSADAQDFFAALKIEEQDTKGAYTQVKIVEGLIAVGSDDYDEGSEFARVFYDHACTQVDDLVDAQACMKFWSEQVMPSFEDVNTSYAVESLPAMSAVVPFVDSYLGYDDPAKSTEKIAEYQSATYIGMMVSHIYAGRHMTHYALRTGKNVIPQQIYYENLEDFGWYLDVDEMTEDELKEVLDIATNGLFLGLENPQEIFPAFYEELMERTEYVGE